MDFLIDAQLPPALADWLAAEGHHAAHVVDLGLIASSDSEIWNYAARNNQVIVTKDEDFAIRAIHNSAGPPIVWVRIGNCGNNALRKWLIPLFPLAVNALESGEKLVELA